MASLGVQKNPISRLQEIFQQWKYPLPTYREGGGSYSQFGTEVTIMVDGTTHNFSGLGRTKKVNKANAAQEALDYITQNMPHLLEPPPLSVSRESLTRKVALCSTWGSKVILACRNVLLMKLLVLRLEYGGKVSSTHSD